MKKYICITFASILLSSCGGGSGTPPTPINTAPTTPALTSPGDSQLCVEDPVVFQWNTSSDKEGDPITYLLQIASDSQFKTNLQSLTSSATSYSITLDKAKAYYWRVKASDNKNNASAYSSVFKLYTEGIGIVNYLPFAPELVNPKMNAAVTTPTVNLQWSATDVDAGDILSYQLYIDTVNPPINKITPDLTSPSFNFSPSPLTSYYWYVIVKDNKGGQTIGQVWKFSKD